MSTGKRVKYDLITTNDLKAYKNILKMTNAQLENNEPSNNIKTTRRVKYKTVISTLLLATEGEGGSSFKAALVNVIKIFKNSFTNERHRLHSRRYIIFKRQ